MKTTTKCYFIDVAWGINTCDPCTSATDCSSYNGDEITCTQDKCGFNNCDWDSDNEQCITLTNSCTRNEDCNDNNDCTADICGEDKKCQNKKKSQEFQFQNKD